MEVFQCGLFIAIVLINHIWELLQAEFNMSGRKSSAL